MKSITGRCGLLVTVTLGLLAASMLSCGGNEASQINAGLSQSAQPASNNAPIVYRDHTYREVSLKQALADLDALATPVEVDPGVFKQLKIELAKVLRNYYSGDKAQQLSRKATSGLNPDELSQAWCLQGKVMPTGQATVRWRGRHSGDYDLNGEVNISDITPLGVLFRKLVEVDADGLPISNGTNEWAACVDGDINLEINIADITPIGVNFMSQHGGYRLYWGSSPDGITFTWQPDFIPNPNDAGLPVSKPFSSSTNQGAVQLYSLSFASPVVPEGEKAYVRVVPFDGTSEGIERIIPLYEGPHAIFECGVCHRVTDLEFRGVEASCHLCHSTPPEDKDASWDTAPGLHGNCMMCHDQHGFSITPAEAACGTCHSAIVAEAATSSMPACLDCHVAAHLPNGTPTSADCAACHTDQAAGLADELMQDCSSCHSKHTFSQTYVADTCTACHANPDDNTSLAWSSATATHGECSNCHSLHDFKIADANGKCVTCHDTQVSSGHGGGSADCLGCHNSPHVPEKAMTGVDCISCHPVPPDRPEKTWADAPGNHAQCFMCHIGETHGVKPDPAESICVNCHESLMLDHAPDGMACIECHTYYHVPEKPTGGESCVACHPVPPEKPTATWLEAPGEHANCMECHPGDHPDKPDPAESVCLDCHAVVFPEIHEEEQTVCLTCHTFAHLPEFTLTDDDCNACHDDYVGDGMHIGSCLDCHTTGGHPPGGGWDACFDCHDM